MVEKIKSCVWRQIFLIIMVSAFLSTTVKAAGTGLIQFYFPEDAAGFEITMYKVAEYNLETFTYTEEFKDNSKTCLSWKNAEEMQEAANVLTKFAISRSLSGTPATVGTGGKVLFSGLTDGLYLIRQTGDHSRYTMQSALIAVPCRIDTGEITANVEVYPKIEEKPTKPTATPTPEISRKPDASGAPGTSEIPKSGSNNPGGTTKTGRYVKTGDDTPIGFYVGLALAAVCACGVLYKKKRN